MTQKMNDRIEELTPRLIPFSYRMFGPEQDHDDHFQNMALAMLDREVAWPEFVEQKDSYLVCYAVWKTKHQAHKLCTYLKHVDSIEPVTQNVADDDDGLDVLDVIADQDEANSPEAAAIRHERMSKIAEVLKTLSPDNRRLVAMLYLGYSQDEIARKMGITKGAVSQRKANIAKYLAQVEL